MKKIFFILAFLVVANVAQAQSTATPIVIGTQIIVGGQVVWVPVGTQAPLPTSSQ